MSWLGAWGHRITDFCWRKGRSTLLDVVTGWDRVRAFVLAAGFSVSALSGARWRDTRPLRGVWLRPPSTLAALETQVQNYSRAGVTDLYLETFYHGLSTGKQGVFNRRFTFVSLQSAIAGATPEIAGLASTSGQPAQLDQLNILPQVSLRDYVRGEPNRGSQQVGAPLVTRGERSADARRSQWERSDGQRRL